jgi:hypothetical protein
MKQISIDRVSNQAKIINTNDAMGNKNMKFQQGSTIELYDMLALDGETYFEFFKNAKTKSFPFSNLNQGTLPPGESFNLQRAYLSIVTVDPAQQNRFTDIRELSPATDAPIVGGEFSFMISNQRLVKPLPVISWIGDFNKTAEFDTDSVFQFDTRITIPALLDINGIIRTDAYDPADYPNAFLRLTIQGGGGIFSPRTNY